MLDYEVSRYCLSYLPLGGTYKERNFGAEDEAIKFIKQNRSGWKSYRLIKKMVLVGDIDEY